MTAVKQQCSGPNPISYNKSFKKMPEAQVSPDCPGKQLSDCPGKQPMACSSKPTKPFRERIAEKVVDFNGRLPADGSTCRFTGVCFTDNGEILLADRGNISVKLFSTSGQYLHHVKLSYEPYDVTLIDQMTAAVTLPDERLIQLITLGEKLTTAGTIDVGEMCWSITCLDSKLIVICGDIDSRCTVKMLLKNGREIQRFTCDENGEQLDIAINCHVAATPRAAGHSRLYLTDLGRNKVLSMTADEKV
jgi:hypothetical protein